MREESHLEEMRSAIRGDFERLAERRGEQELMRVADSGPEPTEDEAAEPALADGPGQGPEPEPEEAPAADAEAEPRRSWLQRFLSP